MTGLMALPVSEAHEVKVRAGDVQLHGTLTLPPGARAIVVFAHGSGSSRHSPRNQFVARVLDERGLGTLLFDLLTAAEEVIDDRTARLRFDIDLLARRLADTMDWLQATEDTRGLKIGVFGASTGGGAALVAAAGRPADIGAVVSRGGRPDLAAAALGHVQAPTLLIVGGDDEPVITLNRQAMAHMHAPTRLEIIPGATHLFEEPGALEAVAQLAADWFERYLVDTHSGR